MTDAMTRLIEAVKKACAARHDPDIPSGHLWLYFDAMEKAAAEAETERGGDGWIPVSAEMPEAHKPVIVMERGGDRPCCAIWFAYNLNGKVKTCWHQDTEHAEADSGTYGNGATIDHRELDVVCWRPLPTTPPKDLP